MLTALLALALQIAPQSGAAIVPMEAGASWVFSARVRWTLPDSNQVRRSSIRWEMRITEVHESEGIKAAVVRGFPFQLACYEPAKRPGFDVLVKRSDGLWLAGAKSEEEAKELAKRAVATRDVASYDSLLSAHRTHQADFPTRSAGIHRMQRPVFRSLGIR